MLINWSDGYSVNIKEMDEQHKKLVSLINGFYDALQASMELDAIPSLLDGVIDYTKTHFSSEEELMKQHGFPEYEEQKAAHDDFTKKVLDMQKRYKAGEKNVAGKVALLLSSWLMDHIVMKDKKYGAHLNSRGVT